MINGFTPFTNTSSSQFLSSAQYIANEFPEVTGSVITKVQSQAVDSLATLAYLINMRKTTGNAVDEYEFLVWFNKSKLNNMIFARKNNRTIFEEYYNYNIDSNFLSNYRIVETESRIANIPPISSVTYKLSGNRRMYKVIYSPSEFSEFEYQTDTNKAVLKSYYIDGENILDTLSTKSGASERRSPDLLLAFIQSQFNNTSMAQIQDITYTAPTYFVTYVTSQGTFKVAIDDKGGQLTVSQSAKIGDQTCYDLSVA